MFLYKKLIDRSTLRQGFTIPVEYHATLHSLLGEKINREETRKIKIMLDGQSYDAELKNQKFDEEKFKNHMDVIQIRYGERSPLAKKLREVFASSWNYVEDMKSRPEYSGRKVTIKVPESQQEFFVLNTTDDPNEFIADCITFNEREELAAEIKGVSEMDFEQTEFTPRFDPTSSMGYGKSLVRIRKLDRSIGDSLKQLYDFRYQMTGERIGEQYGALCVEAHHIIPFTESLNNDYSNIIILSPSYHRIVHKAQPEFNFKTLTFNFPNGLNEKVKLNRHLNLKKSNQE